MRDPDQQDEKRNASPLRYASLGFEVVVPLMLFMFAGYKLDGWLDSQPWCFLVGALLGIAVGFYNLFRRFPPVGGGGGGAER